jgi:hypothetical protein
VARQKIISKLAKKLIRSLAILHLLRMDASAYKKILKLQSEPVR